MNVIEKKVKGIEIMAHHSHGGGQPGAEDVLLSMGLHLWGGGIPG